MHPDPPSPEAGDNTFFHPGQADWSEDSLLPIAYQLNRIAENLSLLNQGVPQCKNTDGSLRFGILLATDSTQTTHDVADFPIFLESISTKMTMPIRGVFRHLSYKQNHLQLIYNIFEHIDDVGNRYTD